MIFAELYTIHEKLMICILNEAIENKESSYYQMSRIWLNGLVNPKKPVMVKRYLEYLKAGSTIDLKKLLCDFTDFDETDLFHFNTFCFIDSAKINFNKNGSD